MKKNSVGGQAGRRRYLNGNRNHVGEGYSRGVCAGRGTGSYIRGKRGYAGEGRKRTSDRLIAGGAAAGGIFAGRRVSAGG